MSLSTEELSALRSISGKNQGFWDIRPSLVSKLVELWDSGLTTMKISISLSEISGETISKNAVIGKVHRLGLVERITKPPKPSKTSESEALSHLETRDCRWPIGHPREPGFHFCRAPIAGKPWPYCDKHYRQAKGKHREVDEAG